MEGDSTGLAFAPLLLKVGVSFLTNSHWHFLAIYSQPISLEMFKISERMSKDSRLGSSSLLIYPSAYSHSGRIPLPVYKSHLVVNAELQGHSRSACCGDLRGSGVQNCDKYSDAFPDKPMTIWQSGRGRKKNNRALETGKVGEEPVVLDVLSTYACQPYL